MRTALADAAGHLHVQITGELRWGVGGRTLCAPVQHPDDGACWLRLATLPAAKADAGDRLWTGTADAARFDGKVNKPRLVAIHDTYRDGQALRAELTEYVSEPVCAPSPVLLQELDVTGMWWASLRADLAVIATTGTDRRAVRQEWIDRAVPRYTGRPAPRITEWTAAHADLHPANLTRHTPVILDWEGHGLAPAGYDPAMLMAHCLLVPVTAARVRREFADVLETEPGRAAQLVVAAELLQSAERGYYTELVTSLRNLVQSLP